MTYEEIDKETQQSIQELQVLEHNLQQLLMQKQAFQLELNETLNALDEVKKADDDIYKIVGQVMIKAGKDSVIEELEEKKKLLELRNESLSKQEKLLESKATELKNETHKALNSKK